jgi:hypothetical protein
MKIWRAKHRFLGGKREKKGKKIKKREEEE